MTCRSPRRLLTIAAIEPRRVRSLRAGSGLGSGTLELGSVLARRRDRPAERRESVPGGGTRPRIEDAGTLFDAESLVQSVPLGSGKAVARDPVCRSIPGGHAGILTRQDRCNGLLSHSSGSLGSMRPSGPFGEFCNAQSPAVGPRQGARRREWQALSKGVQHGIGPKAGLPAGRCTSPIAGVTIA